MSIRSYEEAFALAFVILGVALIFSLIPYLFLAFGLKRIAERQGVENSWLAFVPLAQTYILGEVVEHKLGDNAGWKMLGIVVGVGFLQIVPFIGTLLALGLFIFQVVIFHWIFERYSDKVTVLTIFNIITFLTLAPFAVFFIRNNPDLQVVIPSEEGLFN